MFSPARIAGIRI